MQINWCLKGIAENPSFGDAEAAGVLSATGILSNWMLANSGLPTRQANIDAQSALNASAMDDHVNNYAKVAATTPYISLSSGCMEYAGRTNPPIIYPAMRTAARFATKGGRQSGYLFKCWVVTGLKPAAELPGQAEEIRDLNLFANFYAYHRQGEITAKLVVPRRQVSWVVKVDRGASPIPASWSTPAKHYLRNVDFTPPERVSNVLQVL